MVVASVVTAIALLGVYEVLKRALDVEQRMTSENKDRAAAQAVCDHVVDVLSRAVNLGEGPTIVCRPPKDDVEGILECRIGAAGYSDVAASRMCVTRLRYSWGFVEEDDRSGLLLVQTMPYAGSVNIAPIDGVEELEDDALWEKAPQTVLGRRIAKFQVRFKPVAMYHDPEAKWQAKWSGPSGGMAIMVTVKVGGIQAERLLVPPVNGQMGG